MPNRYIRQTTFAGVGDEGQQTLGNSRVAIVGVGALGTVAANCLARSGIGFLRLIDKDHVERINLHRQILYTEEDADRCTPKAVAACAFLARANSEIQLEPVATELTADNAGAMFEDVDLVLDCVDNWQTRFLVNRVCRKQSLPWIYCAVLGSQGMTMNFFTKNYPANDQPCLQCVVPVQAITNSQPTIATEGVLNMTTGTIAAIQAGEAIKILLGSPKIRQGLFIADFWNNVFKTIPFERDANCPACSC